MLNSTIEFISRWHFIKAYWLTGADRYRMLLLHVDKQITLTTDDDTRLVTLSFGRRWIDQNLNIHVQLYGTAARKTERGELSGAIVWLSGLQTFRGGFHTGLPMSTDAELLKRARALFYEGAYAQFLELSSHVAVTYRDTATFQRMRVIAKDRIRKSSDT